MPKQLSYEELQEKVNLLEKQLKDRQYKEILESISDAFFSLDNELKVTYFNAAAEKQLNRKREEVLGKKLFDAFPEARGSVFEEKYTYALNNKKNISFETYFDVPPYKNWYQVTVYPSKIGISVYFQVITARKDQEIRLQEKNEEINAQNEEYLALNEELKEKNEEIQALNEEYQNSNENLEQSKKKYKALFENTGTASCIIESDRTISLVNSRFAELSGYTAQDIENKMEWTVFVHKEDLQKMLKQHELRRKNRQRALRKYEFRFINKQGEQKNVLLTIDIIPGTKQSVASLTDISNQKAYQKTLQSKNEELEAYNEEYLALNEELKEKNEEYASLNEEYQSTIEELKKANATIKESEEKFRSLYESMNEGVALHELVFDKNGVPVNYKIIDTNPKFEKILGIKTKEAKNNLATRVFNTPSPPFFDIYKKVALTGEPYSFENSFSPLNKHFNISVFSPGKNKFATVFEDISKRVESEKELRKIEWLLNPVEKKTKNYTSFTQQIQPNTEQGEICAALSKETLQDIAADLMNLLGTSCAIYEKNGDYAIGVFSPGWCNYLNELSFQNCNTNDINKAMNSEKWLCHKACWKAASKKTIDKGQPITIKCPGRLKIYAIPITSQNRIIGSINIGFGEPPKEDEEIQKIAKKYHADFDVLKKYAFEYETRPKFIIDIAKDRLKKAARLIAETVDRYHIKQSLVENRRRLKDAQKVARIGHVEIDYQTNKITWADVVYDIFNKNPETWTPNYDDIMAMHHPDDIKLLEEKIKEALEQGKSYEIDLRLNLPGDKEKYITAIGNPQKDENGQVTKITGTVQDITERKKTEQALLESEEKFRISFLTSPDSININKLDGTYVDINHGFTQLTGFTRSDVIGIKSTDLHIWAIIEDRKKLVDQLKEKGVVENLESLFRCKDGTLKTGLMSAKVIQLNNEPHILSITRDISLRKKIENELKDKNTFIQTVLDNLPIGVALNKFNEGTATYINKKFEEIYGWDKTILKDIPAFFKKVYPDKAYREKIVGQIMKDVESGNPENMQWENIEITKSDGTKAIVNAVNIPLIHQNTMVSTVIDVTQQKRVEKELIIAKEKAEESDRLKSAFLANMSHEIRTPMNGIIGFSEMFMDDNISPEKRNYYAKIVIDSSQQLLTIVNDILDISRIDTGKVSLDITRVNLNDLLKDLFIFFNPQTQNKNIRLYLHTPLTDKQARIETDKTRLRQIFTNLLNNACKFTQQGHIKFGYETEGDFLKFFVEDTGIGISPDLHEKIFERFRQAELEISKQTGGTGLGLSISQKLTELLGGKMKLESTPGEGSTFYFYLPYQPADTASGNIGQESSSSEQATFVVLVAEDQEINFMFIEESLSKLPGLKVLHARDGVEAVEICKENSTVDLVLMDIKMPRLDGFEATQKIKEMHPDLPIIAQTAYAMTEDREKAYKIGCEGYLAKPIRKNELVAWVEKYMKTPEK